MGIASLKKKSTAKFIGQQLQQHLVRKEYELDSILSVGVLAESGLFMAYDFRKSLSQTLGLNQHEIALCLITEEPVKQPSLEEQVFGQKDFGWNGKLKSKELKRFAEKKFDLLINYCSEDMVYGQVIMLKSKAKMKAGFGKSEHSFNDISIDITGNKIDSFNNELAKYLKLLQLIK